MPRPRIIKSHECFESRYRASDVYRFVTRGDVVISQYHYHRKCKKIEDGYPMEKFVDRFVAGDTCPHGSWGENVGTWLTARHNDPRFLLLKYEDMMADPHREMTEWPRSWESTLTQSVSRKRWNAVQLNACGNSKRRRPTSGGLTKETRKDLSFVRAAKSGGWQNDLPQQLVAKIEDAWPHLMSFLGYKPVTREGPAPAPEFSGLVSSGV